MKNVMKMIVVILIYLLLVVKGVKVIKENNENNDNNDNNDKSNDNVRFREMLDEGGEIEVCEKVVIDLKSWKVFSPQISKLTGKSENVTIEIICDSDGSLLLFDELINIEIKNIKIVIESSLYVNSGLINKIDGCKIDGLHVEFGELNMNIDGNKDIGLISNSIYSSELNDVGIKFNNIKINYKDDIQSQRFSLISVNVLNEKSAEYKGIYIKCKSIEMKSSKSEIENGLLFYSTANTNFKYVVIDISYIYVDIRCSFEYSLFIYKTDLITNLENIYLIIRNSFVYNSQSNVAEDSHISGIVYKNNNILTINHCSINIRFGDINFYFYDGKRDESFKRNMYINSILQSASAEVIIKYLHVDVFFEKEFRELYYKYLGFCVSSSFKCYRKAVKHFYIIAHDIDSIRISNSYFNINTYEEGMVNSFILTPYLNRLLIMNNCYLTDKYKTLEMNVTGLIIDNTDNIFNIVKSIGYNVNNSIIYDPLLPFYNNTEVNYEIFTSKQPFYNISNCKRITRINETSSSYLITIILIVSIICILVIILIYCEIKNYSRYSEYDTVSEENLQNDSYSTVSIDGS